MSPNYTDFTIGIDPPNCILPPSQQQILHIDIKFEGYNIDHSLTSFHNSIPITLQLSVVDLISAVFRQNQLVQEKETQIPTTDEKQAWELVDWSDLAIRGGHRTWLDDAIAEVQHCLSMLCVRPDLEAAYLLHASRQSAKRSTRTLLTHLVTIAPNFGSRCVIDQDEKREKCFGIDNSVGDNVYTFADKLMQDSWYSCNPFPLKIQESQAMERTDKYEDIQKSQDGKNGDHQLQQSHIPKCDLLLRTSQRVILSKDAISGSMLGTLLIQNISSTTVEIHISVSNGFEHAVSIRPQSMKVSPGDDVRCVVEFEGEMTWQSDLNSSPELHVSTLHFPGIAKVPIEFDLGQDMNAQVKKSVSILGDKPHSHSSIQLSQNKIDFGVVEVGWSRKLKVQLYNSLSSSVEVCARIESDVGESMYRIKHNRFRIDPKKTQLVHIQYAPTLEGHSSCRFVFRAFLVEKLHNSGPLDTISQVILTCQGCGVVG